MFPTRLIELIEANADSLADGLISKLKNSPECKTLLQDVPEHELRRRTYEIYRHLADWLSAKTESEIEERYVGIGVRRARQGVSSVTISGRLPQPRSIYGNICSAKV